MANFVKKKREAESKVSKSESSEEIDLNNKEIFVGQVASDDNTICTRGTESSIITILRNSRREHFFDARIKLYREKLSLMEKEGMMRLSSGLGAREKIPGCCKANRYQVYRILVTILGASFVLLAVSGILLLALLPKIAEIQIRNSKMVIREIDVFQISRQNGETSFEVESVLDVEKLSRHKAQFIHSLMQVSYGVGQEKARLLGELYVSHMFENGDGSLTARGRFTIKNRDSVNELITRMTSAMNQGQREEGADEKLTFYGKGLTSLRIFGILVNNVNVDREVSYSLTSRLAGSPEGGSSWREGPGKRISPDNASFLHQSGFKMHGIWLNSHRNNGLRVNIEFELDVEKFLGSDLEGKGRKGSFLPKFHMENIGNLRFDVLFRGEQITEVIWYDVNLRPGSNVWSVSLNFPEKLNNGHKSLIMEIIQKGDISKESLTIRGGESSGGEEAFSDIFKNFEMKIPLSVVKSAVESELGGLSPEGGGVGVLDRLVQFVQVSHIQILQDSEDLGIRARVKAGYVNPLGDHLPVSLNSMVLSSQLVDQKNYYGDLTLRLDEVVSRDQASAFRSLVEESSRSSPAVISMIESGNGSSQQQRRAPRMQPKYESFIESSENKEGSSQHVNKCKPSNGEEINGPLKLNACYNIQEFDMDLKINTDSVKPEVKSRWVENMVFNYRKLETRDSSLDAKITSVFGESDFNGISIRRNLLSNKSKIQLLGTEESLLDEDDYNFDNYYKEDEESEDTAETFSVKNLTNLIDANSVKILGEGFNDSWMTKVRVNHSDTLSRLGLDKLDVGPLGILISFDGSSIGFIGTNNFRIEKNSTIELLGVIKPDHDSGTHEINHSLTQFIKSMITGDRSEIQGKNFSLEFNTGEQGKKNCIKYFNYPKYLSEEDYSGWLRNEEFPPVGEDIKTPAKKRKGWIGKLLNGQRIEIPVTVFDDFTELNIQKYLDRGMESNSDLIKESLCRVQSVFNNDIEFEHSVDSDRKEIKKAIGDKLSERNIVLSNIMFQLFMGKRENDLEIPIGGVFDLRVPNIISKELYMAVSSVRYRLNVYERATERSILEFEHMQDFHDLSEESGDLPLKKEKTEHLDMKFNLDAPSLKLHDDHHQLTNTLYSLLNLPSIASEKVSDLVIKSSLDLGLVSSIGVLKLDNILLTADVGIPECKRRLKALQASETESSINSIFKVESIQVQKIRLILPPRGIDIQINTVIRVPNYVEDIKFDLVMGQCVFELKNQESHLLAIVKTPRQVIIGNNRVTESVCHGFVPAKSWLPMMNLVGSDESNDEELLIRAISTPHGIPYWLVPMFKFIRLPASSTLSSLESTEFGSVTFS